MRSDIKISVVIPVYNRAKIIKRCLDSVLKQTYPPFEIIVVDDCSTDDTVQVIEAYARRDPRIRPLRFSRRKGAQAARNTGIRAAQGEWIAFLDSDDVWLPEKLELQVREISKRKNPCVVHCDAYVFIEEKNEKKLFNTPKLNGFVYKELLSAPGPLFPCILAPKEFFEKIGFLDEDVPSYQEWDTSIALSKYYEFVFIDRPLIIYNIHSGDTISKDRIREADGWRYIVEKYKNDIVNNVGKKVLAKHYSQIAMLYYKAGKFSKAKIYFQKAFLKDFKNPKIISQMLVSSLGRSVFDITIRCYRFLRHLKTVSDTK